MGRKGRGGGGTCRIYRIAVMFPSRVVQGHGHFPRPRPRGRAGKGRELAAVSGSTLILPVNLELARGGGPTWQDLDSLMLLFLWLAMPRMHT